MTHVLRDSFQWVQEHAPTISGLFGLAAGACVLSAGGYNLHNVSLVVAGALEWTSFGTTAFWGKNDKDESEEAAKNSEATFSLSKGLLPWKYPVESFILQQGAAGLGYASAGIDWKSVGDFAHHLVQNTAQVSSGSFVRDTALVLVGGACAAAVVIQNTMPVREGPLHPRTLSSGLLLLSCLGIAYSAKTQHSTGIGVAATLFAISNVSSAISRRQQRPAMAVLAP